jgi:chorismate synthase
MPEPKFINVQEKVLYKINKIGGVGGGISDGIEKGSLNNP